MNSGASILLISKPGRIRDALAGLLKATLPCQSADLVCVESGSQAVEAARVCPPSLVLLAGAPNEPGNQGLMAEICTLSPAARYLYLTEIPDDTGPLALPTGVPIAQLKAAIETLMA